MNVVGYSCVYEPVVPGKAGANLDSAAAAARKRIPFRSSLESIESNAVNLHPGLGCSVCTIRVNKKK